MIARRELFAGLVAASACAGPALGAALRRPADPNDLTGLWTIATATPLERPRSLKALVVSEVEAKAYEIGQASQASQIPGDDVGQLESEWSEPATPLTRIRGEARTSVIVDPADGRLPYTPAGRKALVGAFVGLNDMRGPETRPKSERCLIGFNTPAGAPMLYTPHTGGARQLVQTRGYLVIRAEDNGDMRIIHLDPATAPLEPVRPWMGVSLGRWEAGALVVETSRFHPSEMLRHLPYGLYMSPDAKVVERFTRIAPGAIRYQFAVDDPSVFSKVWRGESLLQATSERMFESACHEGNYSLPNVLAGARRAERDRQTGETLR